MSGALSSSFTEAGGALRFQPPFTASQLQELEHQALIFKYMVAGAPVSPELLIPILQSLDSASTRFFHHSYLGYSSNYEKKLVDPELGRCRRTDGKKWRCSKDASPDSKYCERHMNKGRNRSRKLVESQTNFQSSPSYGGSSVRSSSFRNLRAPSIVKNEEDSLYRSSLLKLQMESVAYDPADKEEHRYLQGGELLSEAYKNKNTSSIEDSENGRVLGLDSNFDDIWRLMPYSNMSSQSNRRNDIVSNVKEEEEHHGMRTFLDENAPSPKGLWPNFT